MVKYTSSLIVAALVAAPALAQSNWEDFDAREYDDLYTRHPDEVGLTARAPSYANDAPRSIFARADDFDETFSRRSYGNDDSLAAREIDALYERALERLEAREMPSFFNFMRDGMKQVKRIAHQPAPPTKGSKDLQGTTGATATHGATNPTEKPCAEETKPPAGETPAGKQVNAGTPGTADGTTKAPASKEVKAETGAPDDTTDSTADSATGAPEARGFDDDAVWERDYYDDNYVYGRGYYDDEVVYGRAYDDGYELNARGDTYGYDLD